MKESLSKYSEIFYTPMLIYFVLLAVISLIAISSALPLTNVQHDNTNFVARQLVFFFISSLAMFVVLMIGITKLRFARWFIYGGTFFLLFIIHFFSTLLPFVPEINGATRWINLGFMSLQPSEFMRIALIIVVADVIQKHNEKIPHETRTMKSDLMLIGKTLGIIVLPAFLIFRQPDSGITLLILLTTALMLIAGGIKWQYIFIVSVIGLAIVYAFILLVNVYPDFLIDVLGVEGYQIRRFDGWFDPFGTISGDGRQLSFGLTAMGSGGIWGNGFRSGTRFFPEPHTDFIFSVIGTDFGLIGVLVVIGIYVLFNFEILNTAILNRGHYNSHVCVGIFASLMLQQFWNIAMQLGILPITGVTLPLISHGGSSILATMIMIGMILSSHIEGKQLKHKDAVYVEGVIYGQI